MSVLKLYVNDGGLQRAVQPGDVYAGGEIIPAAVVTNAITITGQLLAGGFINRAVTGAGTDTIDSAANIVANLLGGVGFTGLQNGVTWRVRWINSAAFVTTVTSTANTGITVTSGTINASSVKEFLVTVVNGTQAAVISGGTSTNTSPVITGLNSLQTATLTVGMVVTNAVAGLQGATIIGINAGNSVTLSANATTTGGVSINFSPVLKVEGIGQMLL